MCLKSGKSMVEIVFVTHIAKSAQIHALTYETLPSHASDAVLFACVAYNIGMSDTDRCVVQKSQIICVLITNSVISSRTRIPLDDNSLVGRRVRARLSDLHNCPAMAFAVVLIIPLPLRASNYSQPWLYLHCVQYKHIQHFFII